MTYNREIFPGVIHLVEGSNMEKLPDQELLTRLRRAALLYVDLGLRERDPYAIKSIGHHIMAYVKELRRRGFTVTNHGSSFIVHQRNQVELRPGELVDEWSMKRRVYWALSDAAEYAKKQGNRRRYAELVGAIVYIYKAWQIKAVSRENRKIAFGDEPNMEMK